MMNSCLRFCRLSTIAVVSILAIGIALHPAVALAQQSEGIEELYPMSDTILSIVFHPQVIIESISDRELRDEVINRLEDEIGIKPGSVSNFSMRFGCDPQLGGENDGMFMLSMETDSDVDDKQIRARLFERFSFTEVEHQGYTLHFDDSRSGNGPCFCKPDNNSLLLSVNERILSLLEQKEEQQGESPDISNLLTELDMQSDLCGYVNFRHDKEAIRSVAENFFQGAPFASEDFIDALLTIESGTFNVHFAEDQVLQGSLETGSEDAARSVAAHLTIAIEMLRDNIHGTLETMDGMPDEVREIMVPSMTALADIFENATATAEGNQVSLKVEKSGGMVDSLNQIMQSMNIGLKMFGERR